MKILKFVIFSIMIISSIESENCNVKSGITSCEIDVGKEDIVSECEYDSETEDCLETLFCSKIQPVTSEECTKGAIKDRDDENKKCIFENNKCVEKTLCEAVTDASNENCQKGLISLSNDICIFNPDTRKCEEKKLCSSTLSKEECNSAITLDPKTKCVFDEGETSCSIVAKACTEITFGASEEICEEISVSGNNGCKYDNVSGKCVEQLKCLNVEEPNDEQKCKSSPTSNYATKKCILKIEGDVKSCQEVNKKCLEITNGATQIICSRAAVSNDKKKCVLNSSKKGCTEENAENSGNLINLSLVVFGLLFLLF